MYGYSLAIGTNRAYVARSSKGISVIDISAVGSPVTLHTTKSSSYCYGLDVDGDRAYLTGGENLRIIDCAEPSNPYSVGYLDAGNYDCRDVQVRDHYAFISAGNHFEVIDLASPTNPVIAGQIGTFNWLHGLALSGEYAYLAIIEGLQIVDISNPYLPAVVGSCKAPQSVWGGHTGSPRLCRC